MKKTRSYSCKDVEMLMASKTIAGSFKANISELSPVRTDWTEQYATELTARIDTAIDTHLGVDARKELRNATASLIAMLGPARRDLSFIKTQIDEDFRREPARRDEILRTLGFANHLKAVQAGNQEALIQLLYQFKTNLTQPLRLDIEAKGVNPALINRIVGFADTVSQANVVQESYKSTTKEISQEVIDTFVNIYTEIIGICKIASAYYRYEPLKREQFTFAKVVANLVGGTRSAISPTPQP